MEQRKCSSDYCDNQVYYAKYCQRCYQMLRKRGTLVPYTGRPIEVRFWERVDKRGPSECWLWIGATDTKGYGQIGRGPRGSKGARAHRVSWEINRGPIPEGLFVCHHCDVRRCVNPLHLFLGTCRDNLRDMAAKGRARGGVFHGPDHCCAKFTAEQVREIRETFAAGGVSKRSIARQHDVNWYTIRDIIERRSYRNVA